MQPRVDPWSNDRNPGPHSLFFFPLFGTPPPLYSFAGRGRAQSTRALAELRLWAKFPPAGMVRGAERAFPVVP